MKGIEVKKRLRESGYLLKNVAELMGETPQNLNSMLNAKDIKTGVIEKIALAIKKPLYFFFDSRNEKNEQKNESGNEIILALVEKIEKLNKRIGELEAENEHLRKSQNVPARKRTINLDDNNEIRKEN